MSFFFACLVSHGAVPDAARDHPGPESAPPTPRRQQGGRARIAGLLSFLRLHSAQRAVEEASGRDLQPGNGKTAVEAMRRHSAQEAAVQLDRMSRPEATNAK